MTCLTCTHWQPKARPDMARQGFARCAHGARWTFLSFTNGCHRFKAAPPDVSQARETWAKRFA